MQIRRMRLLVFLSGLYIVNVTVLATRILFSARIETTLGVQVGRSLRTGVSKHHINLVDASSNNGHVNKTKIFIDPRVNNTADEACTLEFDWGMLRGNDSDNSSSFRILPRNDPCCVAAKPGAIFLLILVTSSPRQFKVRQVIRETWGSISRTADGRRVLTRFVLGRGDARQERAQSQIKAEGEQHGDILQGDFDDVYRNLTRKTITGMNWASRHCPTASYVMKTDSDVYVNVEGIVRYLSNASLDGTHFVVGDVALVSKPARNSIDKWYVSEGTYPLPTYPPYAKGPGYVVSNAVVNLLSECFKETPLFVWEDVYVGMCLKHLGITPTAEERFETYGVWIKNGCDVEKRFVVHSVKYYKMKAVWKVHQRALKLNICSKRTA